MQWVRPRLVAQISFVEWVADNSLRHGRLLWLRTDKPGGRGVWADKGCFADDGGYLRDPCFIVGVALSAYTHECPKDSSSLEEVLYETCRRSTHFLCLL